MLEWPSEQRSRLDRLNRSSNTVNTKTVSEDSQAPGDQRIIDELASQIQTACQKNSEAKATMASLKALANESSNNLSGDRRCNVLSAACLKILKETPSTQVWTYIGSLTYHSSVLEHELPETIIQAAKTCPSFHDSFIQIAKGAVKHAATNPGHPQSPRRREELNQLRQHWQEEGNLIDLWWGLRAGGGYVLQNEDHTLQILAELDLPLFCELLALFDNPYQVAAALYTAGARSSFSRWRQLVSLAPSAFDNRGTWNGSFVLPLLLVTAQEQLEEGRWHLAPDLPTHELENIEKTLRALTAEIATAVSNRADAIPCGQRWATWLFRQILNAMSRSSIQDIAGVQSRGYTEALLLDALGDKLNPKLWDDDPSEDTDPWEPWCYRCVLITYALDNKRSMPNSERFLAQWKLAPEDWAASKGRALRDNASLFISLDKTPDAYGTRVLAYSLATTNNPLRIWNDLWVASATIREIVEFGDSNDDADQSASDRISASEFMQLIFGLGLMMLDRMADNRWGAPYERQPALDTLLPLLTNAANEMTAIDRRDQHYWSEAIRHLAIRRALWTAAAEDGGHSNSPIEIGFSPDTAPSLGQFFCGFRENIESLLAMLEASLRNGVSVETLQNAIQFANIDLAAQVKFAKQLRDISPKHYPISDNQIAAATRLL